MDAPDNLLYEYALIRYVPRVDREEFVNIGLVMMNKRNRWIKAMVIIDDERIRALFPGADLECLKNQIRLFEMKDVPAALLPVEERYRWLTSVKSASLQVSQSHPGLLEERAASGRSPIQQMEEEFSRLFFSLIL